MINIQPFRDKLQVLKKYIEYKIDNPNWVYSIDDFELLHFKGLKGVREYHYNHFNKRLQQRYSLSITLQHYNQLCKTDLIIIKSLPKRKRIGFMSIGGKVVLVVMTANKNAMINTALPVVMMKKFLPEKN